MFVKKIPQAFKQSFAEDLWLCLHHELRGTKCSLGLFLTSSASICDAVLQVWFSVAYPLAIEGMYRIEVFSSRKADKIYA